MSRVMRSVTSPLACSPLEHQPASRAADPDWPKSLTLATASPGGVYYVYGEALAQILTEKLGIPVNPLPTQGSIHNVKLLDSGGAQLGMIDDGDRPAGLERHRRLDRRKQFPEYAGAVSDVRYAFSSRGLAAIRHYDPRTARQEARWCRTESGHRRHLYSSNIEASRDFSRIQLWIVRRCGHRAFGRSHRCFHDD